MPVKSSPRIGCRTCGPWAKLFGALVGPIAVLLAAGCMPYMTPIRPKSPFAAAGPGPLIIAHRGGSFEAPENTLAAVIHGSLCGSDWQEVDVALSADGVPMVLHDDDLDRTTDGHGQVEQTTAAQLRTLHAGRPGMGEGTLGEMRRWGVAVPDFGAVYAREKIPTLDEVLAVPGARLMIELKGTKRVIELARAVVKAVQKRHMTERVAIGSFDYHLLEAVYGLDPSIPLVGIVEHTIGGLDHLLDLPITTLAVDKNLLEQALALAPPGVAVWVWTIYSVVEAQKFAAAGAHGLITDAPAAVVRALRSDATLRSGP